MKVKIEYDELYTSESKRQVEKHYKKLVSSNIHYRDEVANNLAAAFLDGLDIDLAFDDINYLMSVSLRNKEYVINIKCILDRYM